MRRRYFFLLAAGSTALLGMNAIGVRAECSESTSEECGETEGMKSPGDGDDTSEPAETDGTEEGEESGEPDNSDDDSGSNDADDDSSGPEEPSP